MEVPEPKIVKHSSQMIIYNVRSFMIVMGSLLLCVFSMVYNVYLDFKQFVILSVEEKNYSSSYFSCFGSKRNEFATFVFMYMASTTIFFFTSHYFFPQVFIRRSADALVRKEITFNCNILGVLYALLFIFMFAHFIVKRLFEDFNKGLKFYDEPRPIFWLFLLYFFVPFQGIFVVSDTLNIEDDAKEDDIIDEENVNNNVYENVYNHDNEDQNDNDGEYEENDLRWTVSIPYQHFWNGPTTTNATISVDAMSHLSGYITVDEQEANTFHYHED